MQANESETVIWIAVMLVNLIPGCVVSSLYWQVWNQYLLGGVANNKNRWWWNAAVPLGPGNGQ